MQTFTTTPKIACVDLTFNWPPVGGCWIDTHHVLHGLQTRGAEVRLFVPDYQTYYPRGDIKEPLPFPLVKIPFNRLSYNFNQVIKRFQHAVNQFNPDLILLTDGYFMKNHLMTAFGPERCILRFYAYELLCANLHYYRYHENRICDQGYFQNPKECHRCWFRRMPMTGRAFQILLGMKEVHPKLHFSQEYIASLAFSKSYHEKLLDNFSRLKGAIVYNSFMKDHLSPYVNTIHTIPSGVDTKHFTPKPTPLTQELTSNSNQPVKIFLPGRANDPLKGLPTLIQACDMLSHDQFTFEVHYTAAMDCPTSRPWLINRGWVNQDQLPAFYHEMDIVVVPSTWIEPFGITALEGMASALPVVASKIGGLAETIVNEQTGLHFEPGNPIQLADALKTLLLNADFRIKLGNNGRIRTEQHYEWDVIVDHHYVPIVNSTVEKTLSPAESLFAKAT